MSKQLTHNKLFKTFMVLLFAVAANNSYGQSYPTSSFSPSTSLNYKSIRVFKIAGIKTDGHVNQTGRSTGEVSQSIEYVDGHGRPMQSIVIQGSPLGKDIVQPQTYDQAGRQPTQYLPYTTSTNVGGGFKTDALTGTGGYSGSGQYGFYQQTGQGYTTTTYPYAKTVVDPSALGRQEQGGSGAAWQPYDSGIASSGHTVKADVALSASGDNIAKWQKSGSTISSSGTHSGIYKQIEKDANWVSGKAGTKEVYTDLGGKVIAEKLWETESVAITTYYIYDPVVTDRILYVLAPSIAASSFVEGDTTFNKHVYAYHYDERGRVVEKKIPGTGWQYIVYNKLDKPVLTQDSVQRVNHEWTFIKYDVMGRIALSGRYQNSSGRLTVQGLVNAATVNWEQRDAEGGLGYTNDAFPTSNIAETYSANFYDDYDLPGSPWSTLPSGSTEMVKGLPTASLSKVLGTSTYLWKVNYYDEEGQLIVAKAQNNLNGTDEYYSYYNFSGQIDSIKRLSAANGVTTTLREYYVYDHVGRLITTKQRINSQTPVILSSLEYNELGQVISKKLHSIDDGAHYLQTVNYTFNEQGRVRSINDASIAYSGNTKFGLELKYDDGAVPQYNGNISESKWKVARNSTSPQLGYKFSYDKLDRLTAAVSSASGTYNGNYNENAAYDKLGNVRTLNRYALLSGVREKIDSLAYNYEGGKHIKIDDLSGASSGVKALGFNDQVQQATEYVYDGNGRLISDVNKGITGVVYNAANLPEEITWSPTKKLGYQYNAEGEKLQKKYINGSVTMVNAYNRGIEYVGRHADTLQVQYIQTSEGRAWFNGTDFIYEYNLTDHLGNVRATIDADPADVTQRTARLLQENSYYPFGMVMPGADINYIAGNKNNYLYNGKELQEGLGEYDYGARFYDPSIARWSVVDPLAEQFYGLSPYNYVFNNPMAFTDPTGMAPEGGGGKVDPRDEWYRDMWYNPYDGGYYARIHYNWEKDLIGNDLAATTSLMRGARNARDQQRDDLYSQLPTWGGYDPLKTKEYTMAQARQLNGQINSAQYQSKRGNFAQNANQGGDPHAAELAKYGQLVTAVSVSTSIAMVGGATHELGIVKTNKGWYQYYESVYYSHGFGLSWSGNVAYISAKPGKYPTFSDWKGVVGGISMSLKGASGLMLSTSSTYNTIGGSLGFGGTLGFQNGKTAFFSIGSTRLLGEPYRADEIGTPNYSQSYINRQRYLGGQ